MIQINQLNFGYPKQEFLFKQLDLSIKNGSITGLLGKNGAGKSTLLRIIAGLLIPKRGTVKANTHIPHYRLPSFLSETYLVPDEIFMPDNISLQQYIKQIAPLYPNFDHRKMDRICQTFEIKINQPHTKMSYGQKKKFIIAFALSTESKTLLMDEPTNGLDIPSKALFKKIVASESNDQQSIVISTHQVSDIVNLIDTIIIIDEGKIALNSDLYELSTKYTTTESNSLDHQEYLYKENSPGGYKILKKSDNNTNPIELEMLFGAAIAGIQL